jgi:hypothetical protein
LIFLPAGSGICFELALELAGLWGSGLICTKDRMAMYVQFGRGSVEMEMIPCLSTLCVCYLSHNLCSLFRLLLSMSIFDNDQ